MLVQYSEDIEGSVFGEVNLPMLPDRWHHIEFAHVRDEDDEPVTFRVVSATWVIEGNIVEGRIIISRV